MNKRKIVLMAVALCMVAILGFGGTLAYLTDTDQAKNVFTVGNVAIELEENFDKDSAHLIPGVYDEEEKKWNNAITKEVFVNLENPSDDTYVRVHIAIPSILNSTTDAGANRLHFNMSTDSVQAGQWSWHASSKTPGVELPDTDLTAYNRYTTTIDEVSYDVYVVTYMTKLSNKEGGIIKTETPAMYQVYLDPSLDNADIDEIKKTLNDEWNIYVIAEGAQADGFDNAYAALNAAFGNPTDTDYKKPSFEGAQPWDNPELTD